MTNSLAASSLLFLNPCTGAASTVIFKIAMPDDLRGHPRDVYLQCAGAHSRRATVDARGHLALPREFGPTCSVLFTVDGVRYMVGLDFETADGRPLVPVVLAVRALDAA